MSSLMRFVFVGLLCGWLIALPRLPAHGAELRISFEELSQLVGRFADTVSLRLHNVPPGFFDFSSGSELSVGGNSIPLSVPVRYFDRAGGRYVYYLNDINSSSITIGAVSGAVRITLRFESDDVELIGRCVSGTCPSAGLIPDIQWQRPQVSLDLVPVRFGNSIALDVKRVAIGGRPTPTCKSGGGLFVSGLCRALLPYARRIVGNMIGDLNRSLRAQANQDSVKEKLAEALKPYLVLGPVGEVRIRDVTTATSRASITFCIGC